MPDSTQKGTKKAVSHSKPVPSRSFDVLDFPDPFETGAGRSPLDKAGGRTGIDPEVRNVV